FFSSRRRHTRSKRDWSSDVCSSDLLLIWLFTLIVMRLGIQSGIARLAQVFIPVLIVIFVIFVIQALRQPGALDGLNALFTPDWGALASSDVWISAYGQIFFSLSIAFGIMI